MNADRGVRSILNGDAVLKPRGRTQNQAVRDALDAPLAALMVHISDKENALDPATIECGEYIALRYVGMIRYVNRQMRQMLLFVMYGFTLLLLGILTYPFEGQRSLHRWLSIIFAIGCIWIVKLLYEVDTNPVLNHLENAPKAGTDYRGIAARLIDIGGVPALAVIASQFPGVSQFLLSWVRPLLGGH